MYESKKKTIRLTESELTKIAVFSNAAFKSNYLFSEFTSESFVEKYLSVKQFIVEDLFSLVEDEQGEEVEL